jgi:hypothetical protein
MFLKSAALDTSHPDMAELQWPGGGFRSLITDCANSDHSILIIPMLFSIQQSWIALTTINPKENPAIVKATLTCFLLLLTTVQAFQPRPNRVAYPTTINHDYE